MSSSMFSGVSSGLNNAFSVLSNASSGNVTYSNITNAMNNSNYSSTLNSSFASYILNNFSTLDKNSDGSISTAEMNTLSNAINSSGLTSAQLTQLGTAAGLSSSTLEQVLSHFTEIDANHDGKVTSAEISSYRISSAAEKKKTEFSNKMATDQSMFYGDENASSQADSSSILSYKYWNDGNNS